MRNDKIRISFMISTPQSEEVLNYSGQEIIFGRNTDVTVHVADPNFSRAHFKIYSQASVIYISDLGSSNGTFQNGIKLEANQASKLNTFDEITVANSTTAIKILKLAIEDREVEDDSSSEDQQSDSDLTMFSKKLFDAAHMKVEQMIAAATAEADEIIANAHLKIDKDHEKALLKSDQIISEKKIAADLELKKFLEEGKEAITKNYELEVKAKKDELNAYYENEHQRLTAKISEDEKSHVIACEIAVKQHEDEMQEVQKSILLKKSELEQIQKTFDLRASEMERELELNLLDKKEAIKKLGKDFEDEKNNQIQKMEIQVENRKFTLNEELAEIERKLASNQKDYTELYDNYKIKKDEQINALEELTKSRNARIGEIKKLEDELAFKKSQFDEKVSSDNALIATLTEEVSKSKKLKNEIDANLNELKQKTENLQKEAVELKDQVKSEEELLRKKKESLLKIDLEISNKNKEKDEASTQSLNANKELAEVRKKLQASVQEAIRLQEENNAKIGILKNEFLQNKSALQEEMRKLKEDEEKRLQDLTRQELNQINKIKEDSLRIVLDLEDSITKEVCLGSSKVFAATIGVDKFREVGPEFEKGVRASLKKGVLKILQNELGPVDPANEKGMSLKKKKMWKSYSYGALSSLILCASLFFVYERMRYENDPIRKQLEAQALEAQKVPVRKFTPVKTTKLGNNFVNSVIYTEGFYELYTNEQFRSELMKKGSIYLYKKWQIDEEKSIQSYAMIFSLIDALKARAEKIDPDFEKRDIDKMVALEKETMSKLEKILGNEVRLEAALKFQTRFYQDYLNGPGATTSAQESYPGE